MKLAFISDIHEDIVSLRLAISMLEKYKPDKLICLGDICGFNPLYYKYFDQRNAHECLRIIKQNCDVILPGNHDYYASKSLPGISPKFEFPANWYVLVFAKHRQIISHILIT
jgi:Icc-related predicted phosphoesterase